MQDGTAKNILGTEKINTLLFKFALPSVIGMIVTAAYNIVDQVFIGMGVGMVGNAATNIAFPLSTISLAIALLFGVGGAARFNLSMGAGETEKGGKIVGNVITMLILTSIVLMIVTLLFLEQILLLFGATEKIMPYALEYTSICAFGFPFLVLSGGLSHIIRSDGSPNYSMGFMLVGAIINTILDPMFIFIFKMGMSGAALATVISQIITAILAIRYLMHFKTIRIKKKYFKLEADTILSVVSLGMAVSFNQIAMMILQIIMNNLFRYYGALSIYGSEIPIAVSGIIIKVSIVMISFYVGIAQGSQPIISFNYGAKNYDRVKKTYLLAVKSATIISFIGFLIFQLFPRQIMSIFGEGNDLYFQFAENYFRIFMFFTFLVGAQIVSSNFFSSIGKAVIGIFLSLTRQFIFLLPLMILFPLFIGIDGIMYSAPIADFASFIVAVLLVIREFRKMQTNNMV